MKWQDTSQKLPSVWKRVGIILALLFAVAAATLWILNSLHIIQGEWSTVMPIVFTALAAVFGFWQALLAKEQVRLALSQLFSSLFSEKTREPLEPPPLEFVLQVAGTNPKDESATGHLIEHSILFGNHKRLLMVN